MVLALINDTVDSVGIRTVSNTYLGKLLPPFCSVTMCSQSSLSYIFHQGK